MKNNMFRAPLIKSAVLLAAFSLIIFLTVSSPGGSVWGSIGAIFYTIFKAAQLAVGLILALLVCFAVLTGIFFGCVAMVSSENAVKMYNQLHRFVRDKFHSVQSLIRMGDKTKSPDFSGADSPSQVNEMSMHMDNSLEDIRKSQSSIEEKVLTLQSRVERTEQDESVTKLSDWLRSEEDKTKKVQALLELFDQQVLQLKKQAADMTEKLESISSDFSLNELMGRIETLEQSNTDCFSGISLLQEKVDSLSKELAATRTIHSESLQEKEEISSTQEVSDEHRLFSYIENPQDKEKIRQFAAEALNQEMTYTQATEHISKNVSQKTAKVIADHPSLTKEYIRQCRKKH